LCCLSFFFWLLCCLSFFFWLQTTQYPKEEGQTTQ
jgi:hypothetical protein